MRLARAPPADSTSSMPAQVAVTAVNWVTRCALRASRTACGLAKLEITTRVTPLSSVKIVLWMNPSAWPMGAAAAHR